MSKTYRSEAVMTKVARATKKTVVFSQEHRRERKHESTLVRQELQQWERDRIASEVGRMA